MQPPPTRYVERPDGVSIAYQVVGDGPIDMVYASTDWAVLRLEHGTTTWTTAATGLPPVATYGLSLTPGSRTLWAATHGRGAWKLTLP